MQITIKTFDSHTVLEVRTKTPVPDAFEFALMRHDSMLWNEYADSPGDWIQSTDENSGHAVWQYTLTGPWALATAVRWCSVTHKRFGRALAIFQRQPQADKLDDEDCLYPMTFGFNDQVGLTFPELDKAHQAMPDQDYPLGELQLTTPALRVTDPCYTKTTWCASALDVKPGAWRAKAQVGPTDWDSRVKALQIQHQDEAEMPVLPETELEPTKLNAGVDSGQCGFFDDIRYPTEPAQFEYEDNTFYGACCRLTLNPCLPGGGVLADGSGVVTSSGFGDGGYDVYVRRDAQGLIVLVQLRFIGQNESDEDCEED